MGIILHSTEQYGRSSRRNDVPHSTPGSDATRQHAVATGGKCCGVIPDAAAQPRNPAGSQQHCSFCKLPAAQDDRHDSLAGWHPQCLLRFLHCMLKGIH
jgi:hypothetical protein